MRALLRLAAWGGGTCLALMLAVVAIRSDGGSQRLAAAYGKRQTQVATAGAKDLSALTIEQSEQTRRLAELVRSLSADRDRLLVRVTALEHNLDDVSGSISKVIAASERTDSALSARASAVTGPTVVSTITATPLALPRRGVAGPQTRVASADADSEAIATGSIGTTTEFAVDIGGGPSIPALRDLWKAARTNHPVALRGLRPLIAVREGAQPSAVDLRLVAGPLANAAAAATICATLAGAGWSCRSTVFDGQHLPVR